MSRPSRSTWGTVLLALVAGGACARDATPVAPKSPAVEPKARAPRAPLEPGPVDGYGLFLGQGTGPDGQPVIPIRSFRRAGVSLALVVSPRDLQTQVLRMDAIQVKPTSWAELGQVLGSSAYLRALSDAKQHDSALQDAGITHVLPREHGVVLTVDLCPSHRPLDELLFRKILAAFTPEEHPVPVALAITGLWMEKHAVELDHLLTLARTGQLDITWINHSYHHHYDANVPLPQNFLLKKGTNLADEVLLTEAAMIRRGMTPSALFRFPGLISDAKLVDDIISYGLIPVGSDAWLAKKEQARPGDIVLVHGNGNEPQGLSAFFTLLATEKKDIVRRQFLLLDIRASLEDEEAR